jgi:hypothetical protein
MRGLSFKSFAICETHLRVNSRKSVMPSSHPAISEGGHLFPSFGLAGSRISSVTFNFGHCSFLMFRLCVSPVSGVYILFFVPPFQLPRNRGFIPPRFFPNLFHSQMFQIPQPEYPFPFIKRYPSITHSRPLFSLSLSYQVALEIAWCHTIFGSACQPFFAVFILSSI